MHLNPELLREVQESVDTVKRLSAMLQEDCEDMSGCVNGEILTAYLGAANAVEQEIKKLRNQLVDLQTRQMPGL